VRGDIPGEHPLPVSTGRRNKGTSPRCFRSALAPEPALPRGRCPPGLPPRCAPLGGSCRLRVAVSPRGSTCNLVAPVSPPSVAPLVPGWCGQPCAGYRLPGAPWFTLWVTQEPSTRLGESCCATGAPCTPCAPVCRDVHVTGWCHCGRTRCARRAQPVIRWVAGLYTPPPPTHRWSVSREPPTGLPCRAPTEVDCRRVVTYQHPPGGGRGWFCAPWMRGGYAGSAGAPGNPAPPAPVGQTGWHALCA
jgi:hypothetical protein